MVGVVVDAETTLVDDHLMVEPAEHYEVLGVGLPTLCPRVDMVDLKSVPGSAAVGSAHPTLGVEQRSA